MNAPETIDGCAIAGPRDSLWRAFAQNRLQWLPQEGIGWCVPNSYVAYDEDYWEKYRRLDETECAAELTRARIALVARHWSGQVVDVGIGGGRFVRDRGGVTLGYDINAHACRWLRDSGLWRDPYSTVVDAVTFWDSLEHIPDPSALLENVAHWAFVSIPIFADVDHVLRSKHFKPGEHFWYFTESGFMRFMAALGWKCEELNTAEVDAGREDIMSFAFRRVA